MKKRVYIETTIVSYLTAKPSRDLILAAHQELTREWWERRRTAYDLFVSYFVLREAGKGDPEAARRRLSIVKNLPVLRLEHEAVELAENLVEDGLLPDSAATDALHMAMSTIHSMDILLTWNCRHLANGKILKEIGQFVRMKGYDIPTVCTPNELMGDIGEIGD